MGSSPGIFVNFLTAQIFWAFTDESFSRAHTTIWVNNKKRELINRYQKIKNLLFPLKLRPDP